MRRVLVIEDDECIRECIVEILEFQGYAVAEAEDGREGLRKARELAPNLILLDLMMPGMNGWQFRTAQKQDPELASIPVVVVSAVASQSSTELDDISAWFPKPVDVGSLLDAVGRYATAER